MGRPQEKEKRRSSLKDGESKKHPVWENLEGKEDLTALEQR